MFGSPDLLYAGVALAGFALSAALVPVSQLIGRKFGIVDAVNPAKIHTEPRVRCGGIGIFGGFMGGLLLCLAVAAAGGGPIALPEQVAAYLANIKFVSKELVAVLAGATLLFAVGLVDDRKNLRPGVKLAFQVASVAPLIWAGITIKLFLPGAAIGVLLTIAWVVLLTNAFNFLDNMDGLSSGVAMVVLFNLFLVSKAGSEWFMMAIFALLFGAIAGFFIYNFPRARLFMGDSGSLFIGYLIAALSIMVTYYEEGVPTQIPAVAPLVILGVPIFDTISVMIIRWRNGAPLMKGDQNHFSHRLVALGFGRTEAVLFIFMVALTTGLTAVNLRHLEWTGAVLALVQAAMFFVIIHFLERAGQHAAAKRRREEDDR